MIGAAVAVVLLLTVLVLLLGALRCLGAWVAYRDLQVLRRWQEQTVLAQAHADAYAIKRGRA